MGVEALRDVEEQMSEAALAVHPNYNTVLSEFKLTFEAEDSDIAEKYDHEFVALDDCREALEKVCANALCCVFRRRFGMDFRSQIGLYLLKI